ncbi:hypothetical protein BDQ12DRAFT_677968 [Crucibulum laeve]|uniref:Cora-like Mg2+ transporter protein-domain-containing protein n=1 Tax=Crucibulum laeve TaxID=68775 RepID=A0A5C3M815_9AGAR|nr:hypothetical protein BDQ12DRAFT_677968 [Crucibulum laeve]
MQKTGTHTSVFHYPEIESRAGLTLNSFNALQCAQNFPATLVDFLEVNTSTSEPDDPETRVIWEAGWGHHDLVQHFERIPSRPVDDVQTLKLRVIFIKTTISVDSNADTTGRYRSTEFVHLHPHTAEWMKQFGVSPIFLDHIMTGSSFRKIGNSSFTRNSQDGQNALITGFYGYQPTLNVKAAYVWFSHDINAKVSTYIMLNCTPEVKKSIVTLSQNPDAQAIHRPCIIDTIAADHSIYEHGKEITLVRKRFVDFENMEIASHTLSNADMALVVEKLYLLAQVFHIIGENLADFHEWLQFLLEIHAKLSPIHQDLYSVADSLKFLSSSTNIWRRWIMNYIERTQIRINLFFNLATQNDSRTNLDIANLTAKIAVETQRDSSSMITMAAVTMFFLPGTFVSAVFSMVFFNSGFDSQGRPVVSVAPQWWYFPVITIPLTILVFFIWVLWRRWRNRSANIVLPSQVLMPENISGSHSR